MAAVNLALNHTDKTMITQVKFLFVLLLLVAAAGQTSAQAIDSFHVNRSVNPHELFVRMHFPDSGYYIDRTFDRVALIYPPVNLVTFYYRSCEFIKTNPVRDTVILIYTPEPYGLRAWLVRDSNTVTPGCTFAGQRQEMDSLIYDSRHTGITNPGTGNNALYIFPNPATNILQVTGTPGGEVQISDELGRLQLRQKLQNGQETLNIGALVPGLYYIHYYRNGQRLQSQCFSKLP